MAASAAAIGTGWGLVAGSFILAYAVVVRTGRERRSGSAGSHAAYLHGRPRVALISLPGGDSAAWLASALAVRAELHFLIPDSKVDYLRPDLDSRVRISSFRFSPFYRPLRQARECWEVTRRIRELRPDVVHLQQGHHMFNLFLRRLRRYPLVVTIHEPSERHRPRHGARRRPQAIIDRGFRRASRVIIHGEALRSAAAERVVDPSVMHVIPRPAPRRTGVAAEEEFPTILFFGRIWPYKGLEYLIEAEPLVAAAVPGLRTVIAGEGEGMARYRRLMRDPERFDVRNEFVSRELRDELFAKASVVVLPYVDASTSAVVPVAYLHGKPVVVTSVGGLTENVDPGRTGLVVPPRDHLALATALIGVLRDERFRHELGRAGRRKLEVEFAPDLIARRTLEVYALAQNGSTSGDRRFEPERAAVA